MNILDIINKKRLNFSLSKGEIEYVVRAYLDDIIKDYQMSSLLMAMSGGIYLIIRLLPFLWQYISEIWIMMRLLT